MKLSQLVMNCLATIGALALVYILFNVAVALYFLTFMPWR